MQELDISKLLGQLKNFNITVLPDFFLDILIDPKMSYEELIKGIDEVYNRGGGNFLGPEISFVGGGNGGNVAKTTAGLGASTTFISNSSELGKLLIEFYMQPLGIMTSIGTSGKIASSLIFEIPHGDTKFNVMLSSSGSVADFSADKLSLEQWDILNRSKVIAITNAQNYQMEDLVEKILTEIPTDIIVSIDFSDLTPHINRITDIRKRLLEHPIHPPSIIMGNENEIRLLARELGKTPENAINLLSSTYPDTIFCLHMAKKAEIWKMGDIKAREPSFKVPLLKATGAGDNWHAGFLVGFYGLNFNFSKAVKFANAVAGYQISTGEIGNLYEVLNFMTQTPCYLNIST